MLLYRFLIAPLPIAIIFQALLWGCRPQGGPKPADEGPEQLGSPAADFKPADPGASADANGAGRMLTSFDPKDPSLCPDAEGKSWVLHDLIASPESEAAIVYCKTTNSPRYFFARARVFDLATGVQRFEVFSWESDGMAFRLTADRRRLLRDEFNGGYFVTQVLSLEDGRKLSSFDSSLSLTRWFPVVVDNTILWEQDNDYWRAVDFVHDVNDHREHKLQCEGSVDLGGCALRGLNNYVVSPEGHYVFIGLPSKDPATATPFSWKREPRTQLVDLFSDSIKLIDMPGNEDWTDLGADHVPTDWAQFSPDETRLLKARSGGDMVRNRGVRLLELPGAGLIRDFGEIETTADMLGFTGDNRRLVLTRNETTTVYDGKSGEVLGSVSGRADSQFPEQGFVWVPAATKVYDVEADDVGNIAVEAPGTVVFGHRRRDRRFFAWEKGDCTSGQGESGFVDVYGASLAVSRIVGGDGGTCVELNYVAFSYDETKLLVEGRAGMGNEGEGARLFVAAYDVATLKRTVEVDVPSHYRQAFALQNGEVAVLDDSGTLTVYH